MSLRPEYPYSFIIQTFWTPEELGTAQGHISETFLLVRLSPVQTNAKYIKSNRKGLKAAAKNLQEEPRRVHSQISMETP